jgi:hypothetical protein
MLRHLLLIVIFFVTPFRLLAQTGIGTTSPHASAKLEVASDRQGFLPPRIALTATNSASPITSPATGLIIFNTATAGTTPNNVLPGYYYWDGSKWNGLVDQGSLNSFSGFNPNYAQSNASAVSKSAAGDIIVSQSITTSGRPVQIIATGDANPANNGAWVQLQLYRDGTAIGKKVQAESSSSNENVPYCLNFIDNPTTPGTYTYSVRIVGGSGAFGFGESDGNHITILELGAWSAGTMPVSKGGTGNSSFTSGSVMFSDGTNITQKNANLFWDNSNNRLGVGNNAPSATLDVTGNVNVAGALNVTGSSNVNFQTPALLIGNGSGDEGGEIQLATAQTNQSLSGRVIVDVYRNQLRILESGSNNRGVNIDLSKAPNSASGEITWKASGMVAAGTFVSLDNLKCAVTTSGSRGLSVGAVSTTFEADISGWYTVAGGSGGLTANNITYTTTASGSAFGWNFPTHGDMVLVNLRDKTNNRFYRITMMIGSGYVSNFISIERLF